MFGDFYSKVVLTIVAAAISVIAIETLIERSHKNALYKMQAQEIELDKQVQKFSKMRSRLVDEILLKEFDTDTDSLRRLIKKYTNNEADLLRFDATLQSLRDILSVKLDAKAVSNDLNEKVDTLLKKYKQQGDAP